MPRKTATYRYKLEENTMDAITSFAKVHQFDDRHAYKEAWNEWCDDNDNLINFECRRLAQLGYQGNILDKMYKAGRYYFRTKDTTQSDPKERRPYVSMDDVVLSAMDTHIRAQMKNNNFTPAEGYSGFCQNNVPLLKLEVSRLVQGENALNTEEIIAKIKKTYKNRYYLLSRAG